MIVHDCPRKKQDTFELLADGVSMEFSLAPSGIKVNTHAFHTFTVLVLREQLGNYGHFTDSEDFFCEGNLFADLKSLSLNADITPRKHEISSNGAYWRDNNYVMAHGDLGSVDLYKPLGLSLPSNDDFKALLASLSTRLANRYLVTRVIQCSLDPDPCWHFLDIPARLCSFEKPLLWHRNKSTLPPAISTSIRPS